MVTRTLSHYLGLVCGSGGRSDSTSIRSINRSDAFWIWVFDVRTSKEKACCQWETRDEYECCPWINPLLAFLFIGLFSDVTPVPRVRAPIIVVCPWYIPISGFNLGMGID